MEHVIFCFLRDFLKILYFQWTKVLSEVFKTEAEDFTKTAVAEVYPGETNLRDQSVVKRTDSGSLQFVMISSNRFGSLSTLRFRFGLTL